MQFFPDYLQLSSSICTFYQPRPLLITPPASIRGQEGSEPRVHTECGAQVGPDGPCAKTKAGWEGHRDMGPGGTCGSPRKQRLI